MGKPIRWIYSVVGGNEFGLEGYQRHTSPSKNQKSTSSKYGGNKSVEILDIVGTHRKELVNLFDSILTEKS